MRSLHRGGRCRNRRSVHRCVFPRWMRVAGWRAAVRLSQHRHRDGMEGHGQPRPAVRDAVHRRLLRRWLQARVPGRQHPLPRHPRGRRRARKPQLRRGAAQTANRQHLPRGIRLDVPVRRTRRARHHPRLGHPARRLAYTLGARCHGLRAHCLRRKVQHARLRPAAARECQLRHRVHDDQPRSRRAREARRPGHTRHERALELRGVPARPHRVGQALRRAPRQGTAGRPALRRAGGTGQGHRQHADGQVRRLLLHQLQRRGRRAQAGRLRLADDRPRGRQLRVRQPRG